MKRTKLPILLALIMSFQMMVAPIAHANMLEVINMVGSVYNQTAGQGPSMPSPLYGSDMQALTQQQTPGADKYFTAQNLSRLPGLGQYLALNGINPNALNCATLPTTLHEAKNEVCRIGITNDRGVNPAAQLGEMFAYFNQYTQIDKMYRNYTAQSNAEGQQFGVGCMKNAAQILNGYFQYRVNELDKLVTNMEALNNQFREASRADLDAIEESTAVLEGGDNDLVAGVKTRRPDLFDFGKRFNNPACNSMFAADKLNQDGLDAGLNGINKILKTTLNTPDRGSRYSGQSYTQAHANVVADLNALADKAGKQAELNFSSISGPGNGYGEFLRRLPGSVSSTTGTNNALSPDIFADVQTRFTESNNKLQTEAGLISNEMSAGGMDPGKAMSLLRNPNPANFDNEVETIENQMKYACLNRSISDDLESTLSQIYVPGGSDHANKSTGDFLKEKLRQILKNEDTSPEKKLAELKSLEGQAGSRYLLRLGRSYDVEEVDDQDKLITKTKGANKRTPASYFSDVIRNCNAQFKKNKLGNTMSGRDAIKRIRKLQKDYKSLASDHAQEIRNEIRKKMIECSDQVGNISTGSCDGSRFNTSAPGFCAATAITCSQNMQACTQQAQGFVNNIKQERTGRVGNYNALVKKNKQDIVRIFDTALAQYMRDGETMRGLFGAGFTPPADIQREVPASQRFLASFQQATANSEDGRLMLEDPDKYVDMLKRNIANLKKNVTDQQNQILGGNGSSGLLAEHIKQTERNYAAVATQAKTLADACIGKHDEFVRNQEAERQRVAAEEQKRQQELGEQTADFCRRYSMAQQNPNAACSGVPGELFENVGRVAQQAGDPSAVNRLQVICNGVDSSNTNSGSSVNDRWIIAAFISCENTPAGTAKHSSCERFERCMGPPSVAAGTQATAGAQAGAQAGTVQTGACPTVTQLAYAQAILPNFSAQQPATTAGTSASGETSGGAPAVCSAGNNGGRFQPDWSSGAARNTASGGDSAVRN